MHIRDLANAVKGASRRLAVAQTAAKNAALHGAADALERRADEIVRENERDMEEGRRKGLSPALLDRLLLDEARISSMASDVRSVAALPDPVGEIVGGWRTAEGLELAKRRVPFGVVAVIYEARPNVTIDAASLCLKTGNGIILRGGSDAVNSNRVLAGIMKESAAEAGLPADSVGFVESTDRQVLIDLLQLEGLVDLVVPRGGEKLKEFLGEHAKVPVIYAAGGNCHVYVDAAADLDAAVRIAVNAKVQRPGVCNAAETLLVHRDVAHEFIPRAVRELVENGVRLYGDEETRAAAADLASSVEPAEETHYATEFLALEMAVKVVGGVEEAADHIAAYGTGHSEAIVTENLEAARYFTDVVDAAAVYVNASTRFTDGAVYGLGAEIGISTQKLHARGPMGLRELTSTKYVVTGRGHVR